MNLARVHAKLDFLKLMNWKVVSNAKASPADSSGTKVFGTEFFCDAYRLLFEVLGQQAAVREGDVDDELLNRLERAYQGTLILTFGGGVNEIQRDLIAMFGLGMPRTPRM